MDLISLALVVSTLFIISLVILVVILFKKIHHLNQEVIILHKNQNHLYSPNQKFFLRFLVFILSSIYIFMWFISGVFILENITCGFDNFNIWGWVMFIALTLGFILMRIKEKRWAGE